MEIVTTVLAVLGGLYLLFSIVSLAAPKGSKVQAFAERVALALKPFEPKGQNIVESKPAEKEGPK